MQGSGAVGGSHSLSTALPLGVAIRWAQLASFVRRTHALSMPVFSSLRNSDPDLFMTAFVHLVCRKEKLSNKHSPLQMCCSRLNFGKRRVARVSFIPFSFSNSFPFPLLVSVCFVGPASYTNHEHTRNKMCELLYVSLDIRAVAAESICSAMGLEKNNCRPRARRTSHFRRLTFLP